MKVKVSLRVVWKFITWTVPSNWDSQRFRWEPFRTQNKSHKFFNVHHQLQVRAQETRGELERMVQNRACLMLQVRVRVGVSTVGNEEIWQIWVKPLWRLEKIEDGRMFIVYCLYNHSRGGWWMLTGIVCYTLECSRVLVRCKVSEGLSHYQSVLT